MRGIKILFALAVAILAAACQQPGGSAHRSTAAVRSDGLDEAFAAAEAEQRKNYTPSPWFEAKMKDVTVKMVDRLLTRCLDASDKETMEACFHERLLAGFDRNGTLKSHCPPQKDMSEDVTCIMVGGMGHQLASHLGDDAVAAYDWSDPQESTHEVIRQLVLREFRDCLSSGSASDPSECFIARITKTLDLSGSDLDRCTGFKDDDFKLGTCIGESFGYKYVLAAVERM
jgi:hypothetical protein